jgi:hypothetical protein
MDPTMDPTMDPYGPAYRPTFPKGCAGLLSGPCVALLSGNGALDGQSLAVCIWLDASTASIQLGQGYSLEPGMQLQIRHHAIVSQDGFSQRLNSSNVTVAPPKNPPKPIPRITGPSRVGKCDAVYLVI